jgi:tungstate transport system substrate-binding protein
MNAARNLSRGRWCTNQRCKLLVLLLLSCTVLAGCKGPNRIDSDKIITLATTTSFQESGLLDALLPSFTKQTGIEVRVVAVGSGQALQLARRGDADVVVAHAADAEKTFMSEGYGTVRLPLMRDQFVLLGPRLDPAKVRGLPSVTEAFQRIAKARGDFVSRADESGTHVKEKEIWKAAAIKPEGAWYIQAGTGMAAALRMAEEKEAYLLCDRGTYLANRGEPGLEILVQNDPLLINHYSVILVSAEKFPHLDQQAGRKFVDFLVSAETQKQIAAFGKDKYGTQLYVPEAEAPRKK